MAIQNLSVIPDHLKPVLMEHFKMFSPNTVDFTQPVIRASVRDVLALFVILYGFLILTGLAMNTIMGHKIVRKRLYVEPVCAFLLNMVVCNMLMNLVVLPLSLVILLMQNWIFGKGLCFLTPMLQDIPVHATTGSLVAIAIERFRAVAMTSRRKLSSAWVVAGIWAVAMVVVLPYGLYMSYVDMEKYFGAQFAGVGICYVSLADDIASYIRGLFITLYALPLMIIACLHAKTGSALRTRQETSNVMVLGHKRDGESMVSRGSRISQGSRSSQSDVWTPQEVNTATPNSLLGEPDYSGDEIRRHSSMLHTSGPEALLQRGRTSSFRPCEETSELDLEREQRDQRYVASLITSYALCLCPLMILRLVKNMVMETHANSSLFDLILISFVWVAFLPTVTTPTIFALWQKNRTSKNSIDEYLKSARRNHPLPLQDGSRRCSTHPYRHDLPMHVPHTGIGGERLSMEASLSVNPHMGQFQRHHIRDRPLTPTPSHSRGMGSILNPTLQHQERYTRPHSLSFS